MSDGKLVSDEQAVAIVRNYKGGRVAFTKAAAVTYLGIRQSFLDEERYAVENFWDKVPDAPTAEGGAG